ncbi:MAG: response regulator [Phenylobacterium sp.]|uniref:hybrid sensor histidine kinase/response regulator n=1 Tax=Phenylobacterium sp. TaxID=1871053 RepID=UPI0025DDCA02|nr:ATP-binding protein [Phenylobacterium sp.]MBI1197103.1 response regulator [Phenylobacterium sp.]
MSHADRRREPAVVAGILCVAYTLNLWLTNVLRVEAGGVDTIWTANAFVIGAILLLPRRWTPACLAAGFAIQTAVVLAFSHSLFDAVAYSLLNFVEAVVVSTLARRLHTVRLTTPGRFARLIFLALLPVLIVGTALVGLVVLGMKGEFPTVMVMNRLAAKFLGMSVVLPAILLLGQRESRAVRLNPWEAAAGALVAAGLTALIFAPLGGLAVLAMFPAVALLGLRLGQRALTLATVLICAVMFSMVAFVGPPQVLDGFGDVNRKVTIAQVYLAMVFTTGIITALTATHQQRLRALLAGQARADRRSRDRANAASEAKTDFLATMSHEIRTPLNSIIGFAQVLERGDLPEAARDQVGVIRRSGAALLTVVNDILDFSKVEAGRLELDPKPVDLQQVCRDALAIVTETAERKGLSLNMTVAGELAPAYVCDDHRLCQVLLNFLNNAVKFTDTGGVTLALSAAPAGDGADRLRIAVVDTGVGIAPEAQPVLFDRFRQVDSSISRTYGGTGLGLAIAKGLVEAMGGRVGVASTPGEGSTFWMDVELERTEPVSSATSDEANGGELCAHILLVDDHPVNRELGVTLLGLLGCTADVACDGHEAVEAVRMGRYDLILMDVHMPGMDGLSATRAIRALKGPAALTPIVAMSADVLPEQIARMRAAGMVDSVEKPIDVEDLHACLMRWAGRDAEGRAIAAA